MAEKKRRSQLLRQNVGLGFQFQRRWKDRGACSAPTADSNNIQPDEKTNWEGEGCEYFHSHGLEFSLTCIISHIFPSLFCPPIYISSWVIVCYLDFSLKTSGLTVRWSFWRLSSYAIITKEIFPYFLYDAKTLLPLRAIETELSCGGLFLWYSGRVFLLWRLNWV